MRAEDERLIEQMFDNKRQYQIPVYQRNYDWKKNSCLTLFNDIIDAYKNSRSHFLGSIVQVQQDEDNGIKRFIIIDGQQRMTSVNGAATTVGHARDRKSTRLNSSHIH